MKEEEEEEEGKEEETGRINGKRKMESGLRKVRK